VMTEKDNYCIRWIETEINDIGKKGGED
jgi:hypothetical protein